MGSSLEIVMPGKGKASAGKRRSQQPGRAQTPLAAIIGKNLRGLRTDRGHSLERLAKLAGVSRAMLSQIETGRSVPTIVLLLKVADALGVSLAALVAIPEWHRPTVLPRSQAKLLSASGGRFTLRALFAGESRARTEFYEVCIAARHSEVLEPRPGGAQENLIVVQGRVELSMGGHDPVVLGEGDAAHYQAEISRSLRNPDAREAILHLVVSFPGANGR
jgi:transcriptional regulator with XRE-family HTH domain